MFPTRKAADCCDSSAALRVGARRGLCVGWLSKEAAILQPQPGSAPLAACSPTPIHWPSSSPACVVQPTFSNMAQIEIAETARLQPPHSAFEICLDNSWTDERMRDSPLSAFLAATSYLYAVHVLCRAPVGSPCRERGVNPPFFFFFFFFFSCAAPPLSPNTSPSLPPLYLPPLYLPDWTTSPLLGARMHDAGTRRTAVPEHLETTRCALDFK